jgi:hypothetical protein
MSRAPQDGRPVQLESHGFDDSSVYGDTPDDDRQQAGAGQSSSARSRKRLRMVLRDGQTSQVHHGGPTR